MKKILLLLTFISLACVGVGQIISQYIETDSGTEPKGIEIWNNTSSTFDFTTNNLIIEKGVNGGTPSEDYTLSSGTLAAGEVLVIGTLDLQTTTENNGAGFYEQSFTFNGNDALVVKYGGTTTDIFGEPGTGDPGTGWSGSGVQTYNQNISLLYGITTGDTDGWTDPSTRFETVTEHPSGANGDDGFGIAPQSTGNNSPAISNITQSPETVSSSDDVSVTSDITDNDGTIATAELHWGTESGNLGNTINMSSTRATYSTDAPIPAQSDGTTVYYEVYASDNNSGESTSAEQSYTVQNLFSMPFSDDFSIGLYEITLGGEGSAGISDYFFITDGSNISPEYSGISGEFFAGQDINDEGWTGSDSPSQLTWTNIDASGVSNLTFSCDFASEGGGIDASDFLLFEYRVDGGSWNNLIAFENTGGTNNNFYEDTDFDGTGDGLQLSGTFSSFTKEFSISGSIIDIRFTADLDSGGEEFAIDNVSLSEVTILPEPTNHVSSFTAIANGHDQIDLSWGDNDGAQAADGFLIKANTSGAFTDPSDTSDPTEDTDLSDGAGLVKVSHGVETYSFTNLNASTQYFFKIWPYTNSGSDIDFKTDGTVPATDATTATAPIDPEPGELIITEVCGAAASDGDGFLEIYNTTDHEISLDNVRARYWNSNPDRATPDTEIDLSGLIPGNSSVVVARNAGDFNTFYGFAADFSNSDFYFNGGDDGCDIYLTTTSTILDSFNDSGTTASGHAAWTWSDNSVWERTSSGSGAIEANWTEYSSGSGTPKSLLSVTWNGSTNTDWNVAGNWDEIIPGAFQIVTIGATKAEVMINASDDATCHDLTVDGTLTIKSDATETGSLIVHGTATVNGTFTSERYISNDNAWHMISSPVAAQTIQDDGFVPSDGTLSTDFDFYKFDESEATTPWINIRAGDNSVNSSFESNFQTGRGYLVAYTGAHSTDKSFTGIPNSGTQNISLTNSSQSGYNLIGNPYTASIDWSAIDKSNLEEDYYHAYDDTQDDYIYHDGSVGSSGASQYIAPNQGFFVKVSGNTTLDLSTSVLTHSTREIVKEEKVLNHMALVIDNGSLDDEVFIGIDKTSTLNKDRRDASKFFSFNPNAPALYAYTSDEVWVAYNNIPDIDEGTVIQLGTLIPHEGEYTIRLAKLSGLFENVEVTLEDTYLDKLTEMKLDDAYVFTASTDDEHRFNLHLTKSSTIGLDENEELTGVHVYANKRNIYFNADENLTNATLTVYNTIGQVVLTTNVESGSKTIRMENRGAYLVKVQSNQGSISKKVIIQ